MYVSPAYIIVCMFICMLVPLYNCLFVHMYVSPPYIIVCLFICMLVPHYIIVRSFVCMLVPHDKIVCLFICMLVPLLPTLKINGGKQIWSKMRKIKVVENFLKWRENWLKTFFCFYYPFPQPAAGEIMTW